MAFSQSYTKLLPMHVAFIMDGNRRWAKKKKLPVIEGHKMGSEIIKKIVVKSLKLGIKYLTFYSFSTENWNRSKSEVLKLQSLLEFYLDSEIESFKKKMRTPSPRYHQTPGLLCEVMLVIKTSP